MTFTWKLAYIPSIFVDLFSSSYFSYIYIFRNIVIRNLFHLLQGCCHICSIHWEWRNWERSGHIVRSCNEACNFRWTGTCTLCCKVKLSSLYKTKNICSHKSFLIYILNTCTWSLFVCIQRVSLLKNLMNESYRFS